MCVYVPKNALDHVAEAMFTAGAGKVGAYEKCAFYVSGIGQFLPLANSTPHIGEKLQLEHVQEYRLEVMVHDKDFDDVVQAMYNSHPYEEPVWHAFRSLDSKAVKNK